MKAALQGIVVSPMYIITSVSVLVGLCWLDPLSGVLLGWGLSLLAIRSNKLYRLSRVGIDLSIHTVLRLTSVLLGAVGLSLILNLIFVSLILLGLADGSSAMIYSLDTREGLKMLAIALFVSLSFETIVVRYLYLGLTYIFGNGLGAWIISSIVLSLLIALVFINLGWYSSIVIGLIVMYFLSIRQSQAANSSTAVLLYFLFVLWLHFQELLFHEILFTHLY